MDPDRKKYVHLRIRIQVANYHPKTQKIALNPQLSKRAQIVNGLSSFSLKISEQKRKEIMSKHAHNTQKKDFYISLIIFFK